MRIVPLTVLLYVLALIVQAQTEEQDLKKKAKSLLKEAEKIRQLKAKKEIDVSIYSKEQLLDFLKSSLKHELPDHRAIIYQKVGKKFGLFPDNFDIKKAYIELLSQNIAGFYDSRKKELKMIDRPEAKLDDALFQQQFGETLSDSYILHELIHALQDQHNDLTQLMRLDLRNDDVQLALQSVIEGDASVVQWKYFFKDKYDQYKSVFSTGGLSSELGNYPKIITESLIFPYTHGFIFVDKLHTAEGWERVSKAVTDSPLSTEQILHPDKYYKQVDYPTEVKLPLVKIKKVLSKDWVKLDVNVWGEFSIRIMLQEFDIQNAEGVAKGWDGDQYVVYERLEDKRLLSIWYTTWDTENDAKQFFKAYNKLIKKKYKDPELIAEEQSRVIYQSKTEGAILIEMSGTDVLIIEGLEQDDLKKFDFIQSETKKDEFRELKIPEPTDC